MTDKSVREKNPKMSRAEMRRLGESIWGAETWQTRASEFLGVWPQSIRRNLAGKSPIQGPVRAALRLRAEIEKLRSPGLDGPHSAKPGENK